MLESETGEGLYLRGLGVASISAVIQLPGPGVPAARADPGPRSTRAPDTPETRVHQGLGSTRPSGVLASTWLHFGWHPRGCPILQEKCGGSPETCGGRLCPEPRDGPGPTGGPSGPWAREHPGPRDTRDPGAPGTRVYPALRCTPHYVLIYSLTNII